MPHAIAHAMAAAIHTEGAYPLVPASALNQIISEARSLPREQTREAATDLLAFAVEVDGASGQHGALFLGQLLLVVGALIGERDAVDAFARAGLSAARPVQTSKLSEGKSAFAHRLRR